MLATCAVMRLSLPFGGFPSNFVAHLVSSKAIRGQLFRSLRSFVKLQGCFRPLFFQKAPHTPLYLTLNTPPYTRSAAFSSRGAVKRSILLWLLQSINCTASLCHLQSSRELGGRSLHITGDIRFWIGRPHIQIEVAILE